MRRHGRGANMEWVAQGLAVELAQKKEHGRLKTQIFRASAQALHTELLLPWNRRRR